MTNSLLFGQIEKEDFLKNYWNKKPLYFKGAVKNADDLASISDIVEMSLDEDFETRMVYEKDNVWTLKHGPLKEADFKTDKLQTLACHNLNLYDSNFFHLSQELNFIPSWQFDDIMCTYSQVNASVGAHYDKYNVFIIQGQGSRKWKLQLNPDKSFREDLDIKLLQNFVPDVEYDLMPGDVLFIPNGVAHHGITTEKSLSYSLGFKAIEDEHVLQSYMADFSSKLNSEDFFSEKDSKVVTDQFEIKDEVINYFYKTLKEKLTNEATFKNWMISYLTTPREQIDTDASAVYIEEEILELQKENLIFKDIYTRFNSYHNKEGTILSINKELYQMSFDSYNKIKKWFELAPSEPITIDFSDLIGDEWILLIELFKKGTFYFSSNEEEEE